MKHAKKKYYWALILVSCFICGFAVPSLANPQYIYRYINPAPTTQNRLIVNHIVNHKYNFDEGKILYDAGRYSEAVEVLQKAVQDYQQLGDVLKQAVTLGNLSLAHQQLGNWEQAKQAIALSFRLQGIKQTTEAVTEITNRQLSNSSKNILAQTLLIQGRLLFAIGQTEAARQNWQQAEQIFIEAGDMNGSLKARINQAHSLQILGFYHNAIKILKQVESALSSQQNSVEKVVGLRSLGDILQLVGDFKQSRLLLLQSLEIARNLNNQSEILASLFSLGNNALAARQWQQAIDYYQQTVNSSPPLQLKIKAILNHLAILIETKTDVKTNTEAQNLISIISSQLEQIPPSRASVYARINFAECLIKIDQRDIQRSSRLIVTAIETARQINDKHAYAHALGQLGELYEKTQQHREAISLTQKALAVLQAENATDMITYKLQWQLGRLLWAKKDINGAIASYDTAIETLSKLRSDLVAVNHDVQFNFHESVEPVYRQSVELLLQSDNGHPDFQTLDKARQRIEALQIAELDNFFREACLQGKKVILDKIVDQDNPTTAILYPIILDSTLQVIVKFPKQKLKLYNYKINQVEVEATVSQLRQDLLDPSALKSLNIQLQKLYTWLLKKIEPDLAHSGVNTLVFIPDSILRNVPLSALFDGEKYLVEKYAIAINTGLQLLDPQPLEKQQLKALTAGLIEPPPTYQLNHLRAIKSELELIAQAGIQTKTLLNQQFTRKALREQINSAPFNVVHLATHGQFSSHINDTYILAADGPINVREFDRLLRNRDSTQPKAVELLVLSACQTAQGDKRAALGLAGVAIRAGSSSTLASLWQIDDESTAMFVGHFYRELKAKASKAEALRQAQLELLKHPNYRVPSYWSAYVLIGNWL
ncbi:MAG: CHAT domain-containing protein [Calothrix sp. C42_A2020_038]|nr:CHAT domain-containing protein [Calothrix sp. C42_A2020_038]